MGTDLFGKYYNNATKSSIYTTLTCNGRSADELSFDIFNTEGVITDNANTLASIDLADVHVPMTQYTSDMKTIEPFSYIYIKGMSYGDTLMSKFYGKLPDDITNTDNWEYNSTIAFSVKYKEQKHGNIRRIVAIVGGDIIRDVNFIDDINLFFKTAEIPAESSYNDGFIRFDSIKPGFEFWIDHVMFIPNVSVEDTYTLLDEKDYPWIIYISEETYNRKFILCDYMSTVCEIFKDLNESYQADTNRVYLFEDLKQYISNKKYRNGAMKGIVMKATYPQFNADDIYDYQEALKIAHITDRIETYTPIPEKLNDGKDIHIRRIIDVVDSFGDLYNTCRVVCSCDCTGCDDIEKTEDEFIIETLSSENIIGLEGYCDYLTKHDMWNTVGQLYIRTSIPDDPSEPYCKNYIPSMIVYNPNPFPVIINYLTFA